MSTEWENQLQNTMLCTLNQNFLCHVPTQNMMFAKTTHPSFLAHNKLGPNTIAMLLGVILLTSLVWASFARNLIKYLWNKKEQGIFSEIAAAIFSSLPSALSPIA